ncbi:Uncharacterized protein HZ326_21177 [Fusarium oxysporum f. sp. albedinis]|nr:Uncharacterized protein HZ326_21177 [Fusarium oxysporum f. sp. albedinis]
MSICRRLMGQQRDFWSTKIRDRSRWFSVGDKDENSNACTVKSTRDLPTLCKQEKEIGQQTVRLTGDGPESRAQRPAGQMVVSNYEPSA